MTHEIQYQDAADNLKALQATREPVRGRVRALIGDGAGHLVGNNGVPWLLCRLGGDINQLVQAYNGTTLVPSEGMPVILLIQYKEGRVDHYEIERSGGGETWPGYSPGPSGGVVAHHLSHELPGDNTGGWDAVNVYERAFTALRVNSQVIADLSVQVAGGAYAIGDVPYYLQGPVTSPLFTPPGGGSRYDVVTVDASGTIAVVSGGMTLGPLTISVPADTIPLAAVLLIPAQTSILETDILDLRPFTSLGGSSSPPSGAAGGDLSGTYPNPSVKQSSVAFAFDAVLTPSAIATSQNNYNPASLSTANTLRLSASAPVNITGLAGGASGRVLFIHNVGANDITLVSESTSSSAGNRFALNASTLTLTPNTLAIAQYDATDTRWRVTSGSGGNTSDVLADSNADVIVDSNGDIITTP